MMLKNILCIITLLRILVLRSVETKIENSITPNILKNKIYELTGKLVKHCFDEEKENVILALDQTQDISIVLHHSFSAFIPLSIFGVNNAVFKEYTRFRKVYKLDDTHVKKLNYPASSVVIITSSNTTLKNFLNHMRESIWWNHQVDFLLVNTTTQGGCDTAHTFLRTIWTFNILSVVYLCVNLDNQLSAYTFNPYTYLAPRFWNDIQKRHYLNEPWTLMGHVFNESYEILFNHRSTICQTLYFDKARNLHGYNLKTGYREERGLSVYNNRESGYDRCYGYSLAIMCAVLRHINATITVKISSIVGSIDAQDEPHGLIKDVMSSKVDFLLRIFFLSDYWRTQVYPFYADSLVILSAKRLNYASGLLNSFDRNVCALSIAVGIVLLCMQKFILRESISTSAMELMRVLANTSMLKKPQSLSARLFLIVIVISGFVASTLIQSFLQAFNIRRKYVSNIDTAEDLARSNLSVYGAESFRSFIESEEIRSHYRVNETLEKCVNSLLHRNNVTCLYPKMLVVYFTYESSRVHVSKSHVVERSISYTCAEDLPLLSKFSRVLQKMHEGGLIGCLLKRSEDRGKKVRKSSRGHTEIRGIEQFNFSLCTLLLGWVLSACAYLVEMYFETFKKAYLRLTHIMKVKIWYTLLRKK